MDENDLKRYTVILGGGSGILFQPLDETKTYILSAKHVFYEQIKNDNAPDSEMIKKNISYYFSDTQSNPHEINITIGVNYFEHPNNVVDAAILILNENLGFNQIFTDARTTDFNGFALTGYPNSKRHSDERYDKQLINDINSYDDNLITLRLVVNHLDHEHITGFSGGGIIKVNYDNLLLAGIQSKTPTGNCNGEIQTIPIKRYEEIVESNNLSMLLPSFLGNINHLIKPIISFKDTLPDLKPKLQFAYKKQFQRVKCKLNEIYNSEYINQSSSSSYAKKNKYFWESFFEYAFIISLIEDCEVDEAVLIKIKNNKKFIFSDSTKDIYEVYRDILLTAAENISDQCQVLVGTINTPATKKTRRMSACKVPNNIANVDDFENIDRVILRNKIKEIIHLKAIELDCINENEELLKNFELHQIDNILIEIKRLVNEFFNK